jgi:hypothetical protein
MDGFQLMLQNYCSYCPDFEPEVDKLDCTMIGDSTPKTMNNIRCLHERKCANIVENMKGRV